MSVQYVQNNSGETTAVLIPIEEWNRIKNKYPEINEDENFELPQWQKDILDSRLSSVTINPERLRNIEELLKELDSEA